MNKSLAPIPIVRDDNFFKQLLPNLIPGLIAGMFSVIYCISFAALIFSGELSPYLSTGIGLILVTTIVVSIVVSALTSFPPIVAAPQKTTAAVLALLASTIVTAMSSASAEEKFFTVIAAIIFNTVLSGISMWGLGWFKLGGFVRFIPYPVIGGFMAGSGWLLLEGSLRLMTGISVHLNNLPSKLPILFQDNLIMQWLPGVILGILLAVILPRFRHFLVLPAMLVTAFIAFHTTLALLGISIETAASKGWMLGSFPKGDLFQFVTISAITGANWPIVFNQLGSMAALCLINAISLLLNASGLELVAERDIELNQELKIAGIATLVSGIGSGMGGFQSLSQSSLVYRLGGRSRLIGWIAAAVCLVILLAGASIMSYGPKMIVGGMLFYLGLEFLIEWIYGGWFKLSRADYAIVVLILFIVAVVGYLEGIAIGTLAATVLFAINCSQIDVTKRKLSGSTYHSNVLRTPAQEKLLRELGDRIYIIELQGLLFFGTSNKLLMQIRDRLKDESRQIPTNILLDFRLCTGLDASAVLSFVKLKQIASKQQINLVFTNLSPVYLQRLQQGGCLQTDDKTCYNFPDLDRGLEWCEQQILVTSEETPTSNLSLQQQLEANFSHPEQVAQLMHYLKPVHLEKDEYLFRQGDPFNGLYFVESGRVSVVLELGNNQTKRIRSYTGGNTIGEMGLYRQAPRMASVIADEISSLYFLSNQDFESMEIDAPLVASAFHRFIVNLLAERLNHREQELKNLLQ